MNKENCALKLVDKIILYYDARSKKHQKILHRGHIRELCVSVRCMIEVQLSGNFIVYTVCLKFGMNSMPLQAVVY